MSNTLMRKYLDIINEAYEESLDEKWGKPTVLLKSYNALKKSGPHHKGSPEFGRMRELAFAIRAKGGWGKVQDDE